MPLEPSLCCCQWPQTPTHSCLCCCACFADTLFPYLQELGGELGSHLAKNAVSVEQSLRVVYMPQAVFRVRPVGRCTASMPGHSESVLVVAFSPDGKRLATGSGDTTLRFWDLNTQLPLFECKVRGEGCSSSSCCWYARVVISCLAGAAV
jgi:WD40 repeat protein